MGTEALPQIRHVVVLMMENHSFDNYLGMLRDRGVDGFALGPDHEPLATCPDLAGAPVRAFHQPHTWQVRGVPTQSWRATHLQRGGGSLDGFVTSVQRTDPTTPHYRAGMGYWDESDLPFYYGLARTFPVADRWFCSCLGPTFPNRRFLLAGPAHGLMDDLPFHLVDYPPGGTVFDLLTRHGISWINYHSASARRAAMQRAFGGGALNVARRASLAGLRWVPALLSGLQGNLEFTAALYPLALATVLSHLRSMDQFFADAAAGTLPAFSIVDPSFGTNSEEDPQDIQLGEAFAAGVIRAVMHGRGWPETMLFWVYDEHGGYFDHVAPPSAVPPDDVLARSPMDLPAAVVWLLRRLFPRQMVSLAELDGGDRHYDRYGFRVPAVVVSPYARAGYTSHELFDHTSILKLLQVKWNLPSLTRRDAAARAPLDMLDLDHPPAFLHPPELPAPGLSARAGAGGAAADPPQPGPSRPRRGLRRTGGQ